MLTEEMDLGLFLALVKKTSGGVTDYTKLKNLPKINGVTLTGNKLNKDLKISYVIESESDTTITGETVPELTEDQVKEAFTKFNSGTQVLINNLDKNKYFQVIGTVLDDEETEACHIYVLFETKLLLTYYTNGTVDYKVLSSGSNFVGFVDDTSTAFPTTRPDGTELENGDYVKADPNSTFPFSIGTVEFLSKYTEAVYFNNTWTAEDESEAIIECTSFPTDHISNLVIYHLTTRDDGYGPGYYVHYKTKWIRIDEAIKFIDDFEDMKGIDFNKSKFYYLNSDITGYKEGLYYADVNDNIYVRIMPIKYELSIAEDTLSDNDYNIIIDNKDIVYFTYDNNKYYYSYETTDTLIFENSKGILVIDKASKKYTITVDKGIFSCSATFITYLDSIYSVPDVFGATSFSYDELIDSYKTYKYTLLNIGNEYYPIEHVNNTDKFIVIQYKDKGIIKYTNSTTPKTEFIPYIPEKKTLSSATGTLAEVDYNNLINSVDNVILYDENILKYNNSDTTDVYYKNDKYTCKITKTTKAYSISTEPELASTSSINVVYLDKTYSVPDFSSLDATIIAEYLIKHKSCSIKYNNENVEIISFNANTNVLCFYYDGCVVEETLGTKAAEIIPLHGVSKSLSTATGTLSATDYNNLLSNADNYIIYNNKHILKLESNTSTTYTYKNDIYCCVITISTKAYAITSVYKSVKGAIV